MAAVKSFVDQLMTEGTFNFRDLLDRAYRAGVNDGREQMRAAILAAAEAPADIKAAAVVEANKSLASNTRAAHGAVRSAVQRMLISNPQGVSTHQVEQGALAADKSISPRSVGGELRRMRNSLYRFERGLWFLIASDKSEKETTEDTTSAVPPNSATKEETRAPDTAIIT